MNLINFRIKGNEIIIALVDIWFSPTDQRALLGFWRTAEKEIIIDILFIHFEIS